MLNAQQLRASLYVPATHKDLLTIANGHKWPALRSVIFCTEDAVVPRELEFALENLAVCLMEMSIESRLLRFVRVRNPAVMAQVLAMSGVDKLDGFVFPKVTQNKLDEYFNPLVGSKLLTMVTLETVEVFDTQKMIALREHLLANNYQERILALRIGGNDLLSILGIRRPRKMTIYRTPLGHTIAQIVTIFKPYGFNLTAPVFEHIERPDILEAEILEDIAHGLCGKTAIHPAQVPLIESHYRISPSDVEAACHILEGKRAVFKFNGSMCEVATHHAWARNVIELAQVYDNTLPG